VNLPGLVSCGALKVIDDKRATDPLEPSRIAVQCHWDGQISGVHSASIYECTKNALPVDSKYGTTMEMNRVLVLKAEASGMVVVSKRTVTEFSTISTCMIISSPFCILAMYLPSLVDLERSIRWQRVIEWTRRCIPRMYKSGHTHTHGEYDT